MTTAFSDYMTTQLIRQTSPKRGDFFLTMSGTTANADVRRLAGSKYGHAIFYLGDTRATTWRIGEEDVNFPGSDRKRLAFELPLNLKPIEQILAKDKCFGLAHVSPKRLSKKQANQMFALCAGFAHAKKSQGPRGGYSDNMALIYALADTFVNNTTGAMMGNNDNVVTDTHRLASKMFNASVQSVVQLTEGYPNLNCSSLVAWLYKQVGMTITTFSTTTSPGDLYNAVRNNGKFTVTEVTMDSMARAPGARGGASATGPGPVAL